MAETKNLGGLAYAIFAEIDRLQDPELTGDRLKEEITRAQSISGLARQVSQIASLQLSVSKMVCEAQAFGEKVPIPRAPMAKRERFRWQEEHVAYFCEIVPGHSQGEVADMFEDRFGVRLSVSQVKNAKMRYHVRSGTSGGQFKPGQKAWNKGVPSSEWISPEAMERCRASRYQPGNVPLNAKAFKVGDERINADGYTEVKIAELRSKEVKKVWKQKHLIVWEREHGCKVPDGHAVVFADQDKSNFDPSNLVAIRRSDLVPIVTPELVRVGHFDEPSERGDGGFGSTGKWGELYDEMKTEG